MALTHQINTAADLGALAQGIQDRAYVVMRESFFIDVLIRNFGDKKGLNTRTNYNYGTATMQTLGESDDMTSQAFTPSAGQTLTPQEIGAQFFITDARRDTDAPGTIMRDAAMELGLAGAEKVSSDIYGLFSSLTGGTVGAAGSTMTWGYLAAAITRARVAIKNKAMPLFAVLHEYQYHQLAKAASVAGSSLAQAPQFTEGVTRNWYVGSFAGVPIFTSPSIPIDASDDAYGAVFAMDAMAIDWRTLPYIEPERDASRRGTEMNFAGMYGVGVWRPTYGVQIIADATAPTS